MAAANPEITKQIRTDWSHCKFCTVHANSFSLLFQVQGHFCRRNRAVKLGRSDVLTFVALVP
jgi:hypothetical protein